MEGEGECKGAKKHEGGGSVTWACEGVKRLT